MHATGWQRTARRWTATTSSPWTRRRRSRRASSSLVRSAYPEGHPDEELGSDDDIVRDLQHALVGDRLGPLMDASALVFDGERAVGLVLVNRVVGDPPVGGPWVTDICRDSRPAVRRAGTGAARPRPGRLSRRRASESVSLAVTEGNPARRLYESARASAGRDDAQGASSPGEPRGASRERRATERLQSSRYEAHFRSHAWGRTPSAGARSASRRSRRCATRTPSALAGPTPC